MALLGSFWNLKSFQSYTRHLPYRPHSSHLGSVGDLHCIQSCTIKIILRTSAVFGIFRDYSSVPDHTIVTSAVTGTFTVYSRVLDIYRMDHTLMTSANAVNFRVNNRIPGT
ncbi:hypothetical protein RRG08_058372 [Elysia crispata]|uniref:Uncharacterized protein n=1 Tax=Elysia crispata TaxID=231223 RepID=A0AAE1CNA0_9GAST|nr:hypothetical protein RRG08_058372 [Elysia crispata]